MKPIVVRLPYPPSLNHYYRHIVVGGQARVLISAEGRAYIGMAAQFCMLQRAPKGITGRLAVVIDAHEPLYDKNGARLGAVRDMDNFFKPVLDALKAPRKDKDKHYGVYQDDRQIDDLHIRRGPRCPKGEVVVTITRLTPPDLVEQAR